MTPIHFSGFADGKQPSFAVYDAFIHALLPQIDDLAEMKVVLYAIWAVQQRDRAQRFLQRSDWIDDTAFVAGVGGADAIDAGIARAVARGVLLAVVPAGAASPVYVINTEQGRATAAAIVVGVDLGDPGDLLPARPTIYRLYEENIGALTPLIADALRTAADEYPIAWIEDAFRAAVENNARSWRYVEAVLRRWSLQGRSRTQSVAVSDGRGRDAVERVGSDYISGEYRDFIDH